MQKTDWKTQRTKSAVLAFEDSTILRGYSFGAQTDSLGEVVFNTGMTGYQEVITDPSYAGQIVTMTYPEIGNVGINSADFESAGLFLSGFLVGNINIPSNWRCELSLSELLVQKNIPAIAGIDTRALTHKIRTSGTLKAFIHCSKENLSEDICIRKAKDWCGLDNQDYASVVSCKTSYDWDSVAQESGYWGILEGEMPPVEFNVVAYDFGIKWNILRRLRVNGISAKVVPAKTSFEEVLKYKPDGVFFSNGPADPAAVTYAIDAARSLIGRVPIMGICLGHQILSIASGGLTSRLKFGHHGCNNPIKNLSTGAVEITSQNHNYATTYASLKNTPLELTHVNLNDSSIEGIRHKTEPMFAVQYHPEASPGPHDSSYLFKQFKILMSR
jgi:carbamoyl-phosphate synthase small subunit